MNLSNYNIDVSEGSKLSLGDIGNKYRLFRHLISEEERREHSFMVRDDESHLISIEVIVNGRQFMSPPVATSITLLKVKVRWMLEAVMSAYNGK